MQMTPQEIKLAWHSENDELLPFGFKTLEQFNFSPSTIDFLSNAGLPKSAAPYLGFVHELGKPDNRMMKLTDMYDFLGAEFSSYVVIGSSGNGDPIVINVYYSDIIEQLDHEDGFSARFFNSSIATFVCFLVIYKNFLDKIVIENGEDAVMNSYFTNEQLNDLKLQMLGIDPAALTEVSVWNEELEMLLANRDYYLNNG